jgi:formate dehydrogenase major subunit
MTSQVRLTLDGRLVSVPAGTAIWEAARQNGIAIPALCHDPRLRPVGVCRLCVVDVGGRTLVASCVRECEEGMEVRTGGERVERTRRTLTDLLLAEHPTPCARERTTGDCELEALGRSYGIEHCKLKIEKCKLQIEEKTEQSRAPAGSSVSPSLALGTGKSDAPSDNLQFAFFNFQFAISSPKDASSPVIAVDRQACILCDRCIRACDDLQSNEVIGRASRGVGTRIAFDLDQPMGQSTCVSCGECAAACPTGALTNKAISLPLVPRSQTTAVESVCPYCGVGCALTYHVKDNHILWAEGRDSPVNHGRLCVKGRYGWDYALHPQRLTKPLIRRAEAYPKGPLSSAVRGEANNRRPGGIVDYAEVLPAFREASWDEALDLIAQKLGGIKKEYGSSALAGFGSAKCSNEEAYLFQKLMRAVLGTNNVDHCTRLCHASSVAALLEGIGSGAVTNVFGGAADAEVLLLTGTNTTSNHPVAATFFKAAVKRGTKLIVVDPRRPDIARFATWYCRIRPGTDVAFYNALMHVLIGEGLTDEEFIRTRTENFEALRDLVRDYAPERVAGLCGVPAETLRDVAHTIGRANAMMIFWGMGISQHVHGTDNTRCLIALCLLTGNVGRPGTGLHPLRGQNNVQGASDAGLIPMVYPDYQPVGSEAVRRKFEAAWGVALDPKPGLTVVEIVAAALEGRVKGMLAFGENPFLSDPNVNKVRKALARLDFLAVQDLFLTETAEFADVVLPAASFLEKTGTYTNTDRRVQIGRPALVPPGEARPDWEVLQALATRLGYPTYYESPEDVFQEFAELTKNYRGMTYAGLGSQGALWPAESGQPLMFADAFPTPSGRGKFVPCAFAPANELPDAEYPLVLITGRLLEHWHTGTMTRRAAALDALQPGPFVEIHPDDLKRLGIADGQAVVVRSRRGAIRLPARASAAVAPGSVFIPFHFREAPANVLTNDALDPFGKIPEFKFCAVRIEA